MDYTTVIKSLVSGLIIALCGYIYLKTDGIYRLSSHKGIRAFRNAFLFFSLAFAVNIPIFILKESGSLALLMGLHIIFNYALAMGGFFLVYSLVWKDMAPDWQYALHAAALALAAIDFLYIRNATFVSQMAILTYGILVSYSSYREGKQPMRQLLFISLVVAFIGYAVNLAAALLNPLVPWFWLIAYAMTLAAFALLSLAVAKSLGGRHG